MIPAGLAARLRSSVGGLPRTFWVLWCGMFVNRVGMFVLPFLAVYLTRSRGFSMSQAGLVGSVWGLGGMLASQLGGYLADHLGRRATMLASLTLGGLGVIALGFTRDLRLIVPLTFVVALLNESYRPAMQATIADVVPPEDRVRAFGILYWVINLGVSFGLVLGGLLASRSYLYLFLGDGFTSLLFALLVFQLVPETMPPHPTHEGAAPKQGFVGGVLAPFRDVPFALFILLSVLVLLIFMQHAAALPIDITSHGVSNAALGAVLAINGIVIVFVQPFVMPWLTRRNRSYVLAAGSALVGLGFGMNAFAARALHYSLASVVWTLGEIAVLPIANAVVADVALPHMRGRYQGAYGLSWGIAGFGAPLIGTTVMQHFGSATLWFGCLAAGLLAALGQIALAPRLGRLRRERSGAS